MKSNLLCHGNSQEHMKNMKYGKSSAERSANESTSTDEATSMDVGTESSSDTTFVVPATKTVKRQAFQEAWLKDPQIQLLLKPVEDNPYKGRCRVSSKFVTAMKTDLNNHATGRARCMNMIHQTEALTSTVERTFAEQVKLAEMTVCMDAVEHNRSFQSYCHFIEMLQKALPNRDILPHMSLNKKKMRAIVKNVINKPIIAESTETLQGKFLSVLIDETSDITDMKILCFLIRYVHKGQICTDLLDLIRIKECTAENLYQCFRHSLKKYNLPITMQMSWSEHTLIDFPSVRRQSRNVCVPMHLPLVAFGGIT